MKIPLLLISVAIVAMMLIPLESDGSPEGIDVSEKINSLVEGDVLVIENNSVIGKDATVPYGATLVLACQNNDKSVLDNGMNPCGGDIDEGAEEFISLTVKSGVTLDVRGCVVVNAVTGWKCVPGDVNGRWNGNTGITGGYAHLINEGRVTIENGGIYNNYGMTSGDGDILVKNGGTLKDRYEIVNWRGGTMASSCLNNGIYPMNEYSMHSVSCRTILENGSSLVGTVKLFMGGQFNTAELNIVGSNNSLILLGGESRLVKTYSSGSGKTVMEIHGDAVFSETRLSLQGATMSTGMMSFPLDGHISMILKDGTFTVTEDFKLLPGSDVSVIDGKLVVDSDSELTAYDFFDDETSWTGTEYPVRTPAYILLDNSVAIVEGCLTGRVFVVDDSTLELGRFGTLSSITSEVRGENDVKRIYHRAVIISGQPTEHIGACYLDGHMSRQWDGSALGGREMLYSHVCDTPEYEMLQKELSENDDANIDDIGTYSVFGASEILYKAKVSYGDSVRMDTASASGTNAGGLCISNGLSDPMSIVFSGCTIDFLEIKISHYGFPAGTTVGVLNSDNGTVLFFGKVDSDGMISFKAYDGSDFVVGSMASGEGTDTSIYLVAGMVAVLIASMVVMVITMKNSPPKPGKKELRLKIIAIIVAVVSLISFAAAVAPTDEPVSMSIDNIGLGAEEDDIILTADVTIKSNLRLDLHDIVLCAEIVDSGWLDDIEASRISVDNIPAKGSQTVTVRIGIPSLSFRMAFESILDSKITSMSLNVRVDGSYGMVTDVHASADASYRISDGAVHTLSSGTESSRYYIIEGVHSPLSWDGFDIDIVSSGYHLSIEVDLDSDKILMHVYAAYDGKGISIEKLFSEASWEGATGTVSGNPVTVTDNLMTGIEWVIGELEARS